MSRTILTYSALSSFQHCRRKYEYRYLRGLKPMETPEALSLGSTVHEALEVWFAKPNTPWSIKANAEFRKAAAIDMVLSHNELDNQNLLKAEAMIDGYIQRYPTERFEVVDVELPFKTRIFNPRTNFPMHHYDYAGKIDAVVRLDGKLYILEHKTTSRIDDAYMSRIAIDSQIALYAQALERVLGERVHGAIYDVLQKPSIRMKIAETDEEFEARRQALIAKSKTGKTSAKQRSGETEDEFYTRCMTECSKPESYHREIVQFDKESLDATRIDLIKIVHDMHTAKKADAYYRNTSSCTKWGRPCEYLPLCKANGNVDKCQGLYKKERANEELPEDVGGAA